MTSEKDKKIQLLSDENAALKDDIRLLKKHLHENFFSSVKDMTLEDYELVTEQETDAIFKGNQQGDFILVNDYATKLTGYTEKELLKMNISKLFSSTILNLKPLRFDLILEGKSVQNRRIITKKDGSELIIEMTSKKLSDQSLICIMRDISKEDQLQYALKTSEDKFRKVFDNAADIMVLAKFNNSEIPQIIDVNKATIKVLEYSRNELIDKKITILLKNKNNNLHIKKFSKVLLGKKIIFESQFIKKNGVRFPVEISAKLIKIQNDKFVHLIARDINERLIIQNRIKASEEKYKLLFTMLPYGGEIINTKGIIIEVSPGTAKMLGYKPNELIGVHLSNIIAPESIDAFKNKFPSILKGKTESAEINLIKKDGTKITVIRAGQPIKNEKGEVESILSLSLDITERKNIEKALLEKNKIYETQNNHYILLNEELIIAKEKAEESNRLKSAFLANMSHEIRTPMNGILGFSQLLQIPELPYSKINNYTNIIIKSGNHLLNIINDIIDISKIDAGQFQIHKSIVNINVVIGELFTFFNLQKSEKLKEHIEIKTQLPLSNNDVNIYTDETRFRQVFTNLINNALKFTEKGYIEIGYKLENKNLVFYVKDTGIGIDPAAQKIIFDRFMQATINTEKLYGGTGLGLPIAKACTELLGGDIWLKSKKEIGSTFFFSIPYHKKNPKKQFKNNFNDDIIFNHEKVLIIEDDKSNLMYLQEVLKIYNLNIHFGETADEAIEFSKKIKFDLILMDIQLPGKDGNYAIKEIKKTLPEIPIIAQSAYAFQSDKDLSYKAGCDDYIVKPIKKELLLKVIKKHLTKT